MKTFLSLLLLASTSLALPSLPPSKFSCFGCFHRLICLAITAGIPKCALVNCARPLCANGAQPITPEGECCPICLPGQDCTIVLCSSPNCGPFDTIVTPPGECCPQCQINCALVPPCEVPLCPPNKKPVVPEGQCCPVCQLDCSNALCIPPNCRKFETLVTPEGECCSQCKSLLHSN